MVNNMSVFLVCKRSCFVSTGEKLGRSEIFCILLRSDMHAGLFDFSDIAMWVDILAFCLLRFICPAAS